MIQIEVARLNSLGLGFCNYMCSLDKYKDNQRSPEFMLFPLSDKVIDYDTVADREQARDNLLSMFTCFRKEADGNYPAYGLIFYFDYDEEIIHFFDLFEKKSNFFFNNQLFYIPYIQLHMPQNSSVDAPHFHAVVIPKDFKDIDESTLTQNIFNTIDFPIDKGKYEYKVHFNIKR
mgnify:CR=1 FL=1